MHHSFIHLLPTTSVQGLFKPLLCCFQGQRQYTIVQTYACPGVHHAVNMLLTWTCRDVLVCSQKELQLETQLDWSQTEVATPHAVCTDKSTKAPLLCPYPVLKQQRLHHRGDANHCLSFPWNPNGDQVTLSEASTYWNTLLKCLWFVQTCWLPPYTSSYSEWGLGGVFILVVVPVLKTK